MVHGTVHTPARGWDAVDDLPDADEPGIPGKRRKRPSSRGVAWTEEERRTWETWREGDPVPGEEKETMEIQSSAQLGAACVARIKELELAAAAIQQQLDGIRGEAKRLAAVARLCEVEIPQGLVLVRTGPKPSAPGETSPCPECGARYQALAVHRRKVHAVIGAQTAARLARTAPL